jgi:dGTPase
VDDLREIPLTAGMIAEIDADYPGLDEVRRGAELVRELISHLISAVILEAHRRLEQARPASANDVRKHGEALIAFPGETMQAETAIKAFLKVRMYRHERVMRVMRDAERLVSDLFARYQADPAAMPAEWLPAESESETEAERARRIGNFIAGMTDRFALTEHRRLFDSTPDLR